jgi:hypothetical protein
LLPKSGAPPSRWFLHKAVEQVRKTAVSGHRVVLKMPSRPLHFDRSSGCQMLPAHFCGRDGSDDIADSLDQFFPDKDLEPPHDVCH